MQKRFTVCFTLLALLLQLTLPFFAVYSLPQNADAAELESLFGDKILVCTAEGFRWVTPDELAKHPPATHDNIQCALCYLHAKVNGTPTVSGSAAIALMLPNAHRLKPLWPDSPLSFSPRLDRTPAPPRAPPLLG